MWWMNLVNLKTFFKFNADRVSAENFVCIEIDKLCLVYKQVSVIECL